MNTQIESFLHTIFSTYIPDPKWYPFILIGIIILALFLVYFLFSYIRSFIAWIFGVSEVARLQKEQNALLRELIALSEEQNNLLYELYVENEKKEEIIEVDDFTETTIIKENPNENSQEFIEEEAGIEEEISEKNSENSEKNSENSEKNSEKSHQTKKKKFFQKK